ncbi:hypothetical protein HCN44_004409 [Aphidius gifuensis]|uniref:PSI domain-containing protein n=1 Tax=Aphidius gifuensis TaxID=684658 RepID=A0A835CT23_APHGI|nr:plexin domain-containing protein 2 [Aphidius gifuensis]KAF7994937.1 hypothetical protein HCN44_004409 [Aphidius gifuensis]
MASLYFLSRGCIIGFTIAFIFLASTPAIAEPDSILNYNVDEADEAAIQHTFYTKELDGNVMPKRSERSVEPPPPLLPSSSPPPSSSVVTSMQSFSTQQKPMTDQTIIKSATGTSTNVTYSTDNSNNSTTKESTLNLSQTTLKPDIKKTDKDSKFIVSNPINPTSTIGQPLKPITIWANQTRWPNATRDITKINSTQKLNTTIKINDANTTDVDDISINQFSGQVSNNTLTKNNITKTEVDTHQYYNSTLIIDEKIGKEYWIDIDNHPDKKINELLSQSHRRATTVKLKFDFPFYGHKVRNITIATGGFLYTGDYVHSWLAATQYIAPLMANFDTTMSKDSYVKYADNGTAFTVVWEKVVLQDKKDAGPFTFQATLHENGDIVFVYSDMPLLVEEIEDKAHPVKVGLSDAYIMDRTVFFVRRKTIYEYHRVNFNRQEIKNWTTIYLRALPTCLQQENCTDCLTKVPDFACKWCPELNRCSTGTSRFRQNWIEKGCELRSIKEEHSCPANTKILTTNIDINNRIVNDHELSASIETNKFSHEPIIVGHPQHDTMNMRHMGMSGIIGVFLIISMIMGLVCWSAYAYRNPHSTSGQMLIRYRPSQWTWRRGEARYTAATIHM